MIAPSAGLISGHEAPKSERRHRQHTAIMPGSGPARRPVTQPGGSNPAASELDTGLIPGHPGTGHGAGRRTGSTPTAEHAGP